MKINGYELEVDFTDADFIDKIEKYAKEVSEQVELTKRKEMGMAEFIRKECEIVRNFFDNVFGKGTAKKIFGNKYSLSICISTFQQFIEAKLSQQKELEEIINKYSPERLK
jgi:hypothetical protein